MSSPAPALPELAGDLWRIAQTAAGGRGFQFDSRCASEMQDFIRSAVVTLVRDQALENPEKIAQSKESVVRLVGKMIEAAIAQQRGQFIKGTEATTTNTLQDIHFYQARISFCPCYPFC